MKGYALKARSQCVNGIAGIGWFDLRMADRGSKLIHLTRFGDGA